MKNERFATSYNFNTRLLLPLLVLLCTFSTHAQNQTLPIVIQWDDNELVKVGEETVSIPIIQGNEYRDNLPFFSYSQRVKNGKYNLSYSALTTTPAPAADIQYLNREHAVVKDQPDIQLVVSKARNESYFHASVFPYVKKNGQIHRITGLTVEADYLGQDFVMLEKDFVATSVLSSGNWYKISVEKDGMYKIDKEFLESCGIDVATLNPQHINIYGNSSGRLSELNSAYFFDDLAKDAIQVVGESDGTFDDDDYILFYGTSPNRWDYTQLFGFDRNQHIYSEVNCYFIRIDATDPPLRVQSYGPSADPVTHNVTSYTYRDIHEVEKTNLVKGGQLWYGELFDAELSQQILFNVPDIDLSSPVNAHYAVASNARTNWNRFEFTLNGTLLHRDTLSLTGDPNYGRDSGRFSFTPTSTALPIMVTLVRNSPAVRGYLDFLEITARRNLRMTGSQILFRDLASVGLGNTSQFTIGGMNANFTVWDVTNPRVPAAVTGTLAGTDFSFTANTDSLREFLVFHGTNNLLEPKFVEQVPNQDLHALEQADYLIITPPAFAAHAQRLANLHEQQGTSTHVVTTTQVYNEYSSGMVDAMAIRRFAKMFYDRAAGDPAIQPKYLLLFGDATYDPKNRLGGNNYFVPTYEVVNSENYISAMATDDYFGVLDDSESTSGSDGMDIAVGRLLISNDQHAIEQVNKIEHYMKNGSSLFLSGTDPNACCTGTNGSTFGDWRLNYALVTDDEQGGVFITTDAEPIIEDVQASHPEMNYTKLYTDAYQQTSSAGGQRYPEVFDAITDRVQRGALVINYVGHGGETGAADERIITIPQIQSWTNIDKLALFVTATCEFTRFDDPSRVSAGEWISLNPTGGAIALMTTTRSVQINVNSLTIKRFYENVFERDAEGHGLPFGEIMRLTKNTSGTSPNRRSFNLIGDPALRIALPYWKVVTDSINHMDPTIEMDTVRALSKMQVKGHLEDADGNVLAAFNGVLSPTVFDKPKLTQTLGNDPESPIVQFETQNSALYKGKASVVNGYFSFEFIVPKDIIYQYAPGKISYYGQETINDAMGFDTNFIVGGIDTSATLDVVGPTVDIYLNDNNFVNGGITSQTPVLMVECFDENGINTAGSGVGHDLVAILDGNTAEPIVLNNYYTGNLDSYQSGKVMYTMKELSVGPHTLDVKVWDVNNNSSSAHIEFTVVEDAEIKLDHVLNYPNPFTTRTTFFFEHNQSCSSLEAQIQIYTVSGRLVKTINKLVPTTGFRAEGIEWDGRDDFGDQLAKGVYVYRLSVELPDGGKAEKLEKLVLLR